MPTFFPNSVFLVSSHSLRSAPPILPIFSSQALPWALTRSPCTVSHPCQAGAKFPGLRSAERFSAANRSIGVGALLFSKSFPNLETPERVLYPKPPPIIAPIPDASRRRLSLQYRSNETRSAPAGALVSPPAPTERSRLEFCGLDSLGRCQVAGAGFRNASLSAPQ